MFSLNTIGHVHHFSDDPDLNSVLVFNTIQTEEKFAAMHLFQSDRVPVCTHASKLPIPVIERSCYRDPYSQSSGRPRRPKHRTDDQNNLNTRPLDE